MMMTMAQTTTMAMMVRTTTETTGETGARAASLGRGT